MDQTQHAQLSAFLDGDGLHGDADRLVDRLLASGELAATWHRYHLIGDCLRKNTEGANSALTDAIRKRLAEEPTVLAPGRLKVHRESHGHWTRWAAGAAVAAGVASVVVVGVNVTRVEQPEAIRVAVQESPAPVPVAEKPRNIALVSDRGTRWLVSEPEVASKLNRYLANHSDFVASGALNGIVPLATVVGYDE
jgi:sigma-E factor negative regulatory protein RseA